ncbi:MAG: nucleoside triphosphate pyrophosphohydrolase, partial [Chloroflexi bacterium]|nr:nucleoside triphosphate pyrophosphohydrolase [Chloroflexota bacterium]
FSGAGVPAALWAELARRYPASHPVSLVTTVDGPGQVQVMPTTVGELARREAEPGLACLYLPPLPWDQDLGSFATAEQIVARLRGEGGCPWDRQQTHESLKRYLLEECFEALEALDQGAPERVAEELGDLLLQVLLHSEIYREEGAFDVHDVLRGLSTKLIHRHPHVFAGLEVKDAAEVVANWEVLKEAEGKVRESALDGVPVGLPALARALELQRRAAKVGFDWPTPEGAWEKLAEEVQELRAAADPGAQRGELGDVLFSLVNAARWLGLDAEEALRVGNARFERRFRHMERSAREQGSALSSLDLAGLDQLWREAKAAVG